MPHGAYHPEDVGGGGGGVPQGGGGPGLPGFAGAFSGGLGGFGDAFFGSRDRARQSENDYLSTIAKDRALNPNRTTNAALQRNVKGNFLTNLGLMGKEDSGIADFGKGGVFQAFMHSLKNGVNPQLIEEMKNVGGIPGLRFGGQLVGEDPNEFFEAKKAGLGESLGRGLLGAATGFFGG